MQCKLGNIAQYKILTRWQKVNIYENFHQFTSKIKIYIYNKILLQKIVFSKIKKKKKKFDEFSIKFNIFFSLFST